MTRKYPLLLATVLTLMVGCGGSGSATDRQQEANPHPQGNRVLGLDVKQVPAVTYAAAYQQAMDLGVGEVSLALDWESLEPTAGNYDDSLVDTIEAFYPTQPADLTLVLRPLDTPGPRLPADLAGLPFDDPAVIAAFENFLAHLHSRLPKLNASGRLKWIHIGNEIDAELGSDALRWAQWESFFRAARNRIRSLWGIGVEVGSIVQFGALKEPSTRAAYLGFLPELDGAVINYYPLAADFGMRPVSDVAGDFELIVSSIAGKPIWIQECGYASSPVNRSNETRQADFISAVFDAWDRHRDRIELIDFAWQYDVSEAQADQWVLDYGMAGQPYENEFKHYLWSLGLSHHDTTEKLALQRLRDELGARSWQR